MISNLPENFNFNLGEEADALQESIRVFCEKEIAPLVIKRLIQISARRRGNGDRK